MFYKYSILQLFLAKKTIIFILQTYVDLLVPESVVRKSSAWCFDIVDSYSTTSACFTKSYSRYIKGTGSIICMDKKKRKLEGSELLDIEDFQLHKISGIVSASSAIDICSYDKYRMTNNLEESSQEECKSVLVSDNIGTTIEIWEKHTADFHVNNDSLKDRSVETALVKETSFVAPISRSYDSDWFEKQALKGKLRYFAPSELLKLFGFPQNFYFPESVSRKKGFELIGNSLNVDVASAILLYGLEELT